MGLEVIAELVSQCVQGDDRARAQLYSDYHELVMRVVAGKLGTLIGGSPSRADVEDIANEVFLRLFDHDCRLLSRLHKPQALAAWLMTIARNRTTDHVRKNWRRERLHSHMACEAPEAEYGTPETKAVDEERHGSVGRRLEALPAQDRLVLDLFFLQGLKYAEIAQMLHLNINTVSSRLHRAKEKLRVLLAENEDEFTLQS